MQKGSDFDIGVGRMGLCSQEQRCYAVLFTPSFSPLSVSLGNPSRKSENSLVPRASLYLTRGSPG